MIDPNVVAKFYRDLVPRQVPWMPCPSVLTFLATTSAPGTHAAVGLMGLVGLAPGESPTDMHVRLRGALPRPLLAGETVTVSISRYEKFHGYQLKTAPLRSASALDEALGAPSRGELVLHTRQTYTTHHGPYELTFFERIPYEEVQAQVGAMKHAVLAVGPGVNVSPRFVWHHRVKLGRLATFHGDGVTMKTFRNLQANKASVRVVFDFERLEGYAAYGKTEEVAPESEPDAYRDICAGFTALGFGKPSRLFRHVAERIEPLALALARG